MRVAVVGGGSTYTPELIDGFARLPFTVDEVVLIDPALSRLGDRRRSSADGSSPRYGSSTGLLWTNDLDAGLTDADVVLLQLRVGGQATRISDETFPLECGCVGQETTGAGGLAKALRTVPVVLDIARRARKRAAPDAWIVAFTNPVGIVTRALLDDGHRALGLCNVAIGLQRLLAGLLDVTPEDVTLDHVGLNHLTWERAATVDGVDRLPELIAKHGDFLAEHLELPAELLRLTACRRTTCGTSTATTRWWPSSGHADPRARGSPRSSVNSLPCTRIRRSTRSRRCCPSGAARTTRRRRSGCWPRCTARPARTR